MSAYPHQCGKLLATIARKYCPDGLPDHTITATATGNIAMRPDLLTKYLRHLDLSEFVIPAKPESWRPGAQSECQFWLGYYHQLHEYKKATPTG